MLSEVFQSATSFNQTICWDVHGKILVDNFGGTPGGGWCEEPDKWPTVAPTFNVDYVMTIPTEYGLLSDMSYGNFGHFKYPSE